MENVESKYYKNWKLRSEYKERLDVTIDTIWSIIDEIELVDAQMEVLLKRRKILIKQLKDLKG